MKNILFKIQGKIYRCIAKLFKYRPISYPYISGDGFRSMAEHIYDETVKCDATNIKNNNIVFLKADMIKEWFELIHPQINCKYKLITHNSDSRVGEKEALFVDDKIIKWYAQNNTFKHEKIIPIPIGIENKSIFVNGWSLMKVAKKLKNETGKRKKDKILYGFNVNTNIKERTTALNSLKKCSVSEGIKSRITPIEYNEILSKYKFVASPEGNGPDCIRTWEAMVYGVIPIIRNVSNCQVISQNSLPIMLINDWREIEGLNEEKLIEIYNNNDLSKKSGINMFDYWQKIIKNNE